VARIPVVVDNALRIDGNYLGHALADEIFDELTIVNTAKETAKRHKRWGWQDLPDDFLLADIQGDTLILPRGYALQLKLLLREHNHSVQWIDRRKWQRGEQFEWRKPFQPRPHQPDAIAAMIKHQQGIYHSPTGSGKSLTAIALIQRLRPAKAIVLVDKLELLNQWVKGFNEWLKVSGRNSLVGQIGDGLWIDHPRLIVATLQTLWKYLQENPTNQSLLSIFQMTDLVILDECHHVPAETIQEIVGRFYARLRLGMSATPDRLDDRFEITQNVLGEVVHRDDEDRLRRMGILVRPRVHVVRTDWRYDYWPDHTSDDKGNCSKTGCKRKDKHSHRNNYQALKDTLVYDEQRNRLVIDTIRRNIGSGSIHLVVSDEVRQLESLYMLLLSIYPHSSGTPGVFVLTGRITGKKRQSLLHEIAQAEKAIVFATVAKEGLDIPRIDRIYLPFPASNPKKVEQWVGRGTRIAEGKGDVIVFDFADDVSVLKQQFRKRRYGCYDQMKLEVIM
jgi:superfamily II DNA or RNA helicase